MSDKVYKTNRDKKKESKKNTKGIYSSKHIRVKETTNNNNKSKVKK